MAEADIQAPRGDVLIPFLFEDQAVRGAVVSIDSGIDTMLGPREYPAGLRTIIAQACAAMPLLATHLKSEGKINLQFQGEGGVSLLVAQVDHELTVRGTAKFDERAERGDGSFTALLADGRLALILEPKQGQQHYQAIVPVAGESLARALEAYFRQSEQLETRLLLAASEHRLTGVLVQRMPEQSGRDSDYWQHVGALLDTLSEEEMLAEAASTILHRLFHGEDLRVFEPRPVALRCQCSHASISGMLVGLGRDELQPVLDERGEVEVTCEFCGRSYSYSPTEIETLLDGAEVEQPDGPRH